MNKTRRFKAKAKRAWKRRMNNRRSWKTMMEKRGYQIIESEFLYRLGK